MGKINVVWASYHKPDIIARHYWDQGLLEDIFKQGEFTHYDGMGAVPADEGAIFIINGRTHVEDTDKINADIAKLPWVLFIETGDEEALFPWRDVKHPLMRVWVQLPRMNEHDDVAFHLPNGYRPTTRALLAEIGQQERTIDYFFAGQNNHPRREECLVVAKQFSTVYKAALAESQEFGKEVIPYPKYLEIMTQSKLVLCPSGVESPDNFRLYEALEAGCVPIVDAFSTQVKTHGFWRYLFGDDVPFPIVSYWDKLPDMLPQLLAEWPERSAKCSAWWQQKKREIRYKLLDDVKELSR